MIATRLKGMFGGKRAAAPIARGPAVPAGERVYAIGDVHGRLDLLEELLDRIDADDAARGAAKTTIVFLGDLVDRGPQSRQVIDHVITRDWKGRAVRHLQGNHEEVFLLALTGDPEAVRYWTRIGGNEAMMSYGVPGELLARGTSLAIGEDFIPRVPRDHILFLNRMTDHVTIGDYAFVHAGVRPGVALEKQKPSDLRWIRDEFLDHEGDHGAVIVHGHTITEDVEEYPNRIGIDTGAFSSGRLTALGLEGAERWYLQT